MKKVITSFIFGLITLHVHAATWYIDNTAKGANNGTSWANAWTSFSALPGSLSAGDIVYISGGASGQTYGGAQQFPHVTGGVSGNPITFQVGQDAAHSGMVTIDGGGTNNQWIFAAASRPISWITIDGDVNGVSHLQVTNWNGAALLDSGATGLVFRYITSPGNGTGTGTGNCQFRAYNCDYMELDHCVIGPCVNINRNILGIGSGTTANYTTNKIHDCTIFAYYIHGNNYAGGNGDDFMADIKCVHVYHNNFIGVLLSNPSAYTINQHQDGIQTGYDYVFVDSNYFEDCANYCVFVDYENSGGGNWIIINNVFNYADSQLSAQPSCGVAWGSHLSGALLHDILIANNTVFGGGIGIGNNVATNTFSNVNIANNLCYHQGSGSGFTLAAPSTGVTMLCNKSDEGITPGNSKSPANSNTPTWVNPSGSYPNVHYGSSNFQLAPTDTGATANGTNAFASVFDYDAVGTARPSGNWALGAYEKASTPASVPGR